MKRRILHADITKIASDAMIYSTNVRLTLTGGVGAALFREFGVGVQIDLHNSPLGTGRELAEVGDVFETQIRSEDGVRPIFVSWAGWSTEGGS